MKHQAPINGLKLLQWVTGIVQLIYWIMKLMTLTNNYASQAVRD